MLWTIWSCKLNQNSSGQGGAKMTAAGVEIVFDTTRNAVFGLEAFARFGEFRRLFRTLLKLAIEREPDVIICVDFFGLKGRFAQAVRPARGNSAWREMAAENCAIRFAASLGLASKARGQAGEECGFVARDFSIREGVVCEASTGIASRVCGKSNRGSLQRQSIKNRTANREH
jgi:hypothetical protein